jgi:DNA-binding GntR family transcriptional regulator
LHDDSGGDRARGRARDAGKFIVVRAAMPNQAIPKLNRERASDAVFSILRERILTHTFKPGERLNIRVAAEQLGVSLSPVKEAVNRLSTEGLIEVRPQRGTFVTDMVPRDIIEVYEVRLALECLAAEKAVKWASRASIARLKRLLKRMDAPVDTEEARLAYMEADMDFHGTIVEMAGNRLLSRLFRIVDGRVKVGRLLYGGQRWTDTARMNRARSEHKEIVDALEAGDSEQLLEMLRRHISRVSTSLAHDLDPSLKDHREE